MQIIKAIAENPKLQRLSLDSYLLLPMQRITRLPLLMSTITKKFVCKIEKNRCEQAFQNLTKVRQIKFLL